MYKQPSNYARIAAIIPTYTTAGDTTTIIDITGGKETNHTGIQTVINRLARSRAIDLVALKRNAASVTDHSILQPLSLAPGCILFPTKVRPPIVAGDPCMGYINFHAVTSVTANPNKPYHSTITLIGDIQLHVLWAPATVKKYLQHAKLVMSHTAPGPAMRPELAMIAQKQMEVFYDFLVFQALLLKNSPDHS